MRMVYEPCNLDIDISNKDIHACTLSIENPNAMRDFLNELWNVLNGEEGKLYFSEGANSLNPEKKVVYITNPFSTDINDKKIITKLYNEMKEVSLADEYELLSAINSSIVELFDRVSEKLPYPITYDLEIDPLPIFKNYSVMIEKEEESLPEHLTNYIKLMHQILGIELFVFYHISDYLNSEEIKNFLETVAYEQVAVLFIESSVKNRLDSVKYCIIDEDTCLIEY